MRRNRLGLLVILAAIALLAAACSGGGSEANGWIAFRSPEALIVVRPDGSDAHRLSLDNPSDARHPDWSRDGARIAFQADDPFDHRTDLWIAKSDGTKPEKIIDCSAPCGGAADPAWSPDSKRIAYDSFNARNGNAADNELRIIDLATRKVTTVVRSSSGSVGISTPRWAPDGHRLVVSVTRWVTAKLGDDRVLGNALAVIDLDAARPSLRIITPFATFSDYPDWHPSKDVIVFVRGARDPYRFLGRPSNLFTIHPDGSDLTRLTSRGKAHPWIASPAWSPDGSKLLVTLIHDLGDHTLATLEPDGSDLADIVDSDTGKPVLGAHSRQAPA